MSSIAPKWTDCKSLEPLGTGVFDDEYRGLLHLGKPEYVEFYKPPAVSVPVPFIVDIRDCYKQASGVCKHYVWLRSTQRTSLLTCSEILALYKGYEITPPDHYTADEQEMNSVEPISVINSGHYTINKDQYVYAAYLNNKRVLLGFDSKRCSDYDIMYEGRAQSHANPGEEFELLPSKWTIGELERLWGILLEDKTRSSR